MSRPLRIEFPGAWYHVMNRGRRSEKIFLGREDYEAFLKLLKEASELWTVSVAAYSFMPNHYHMLITTPKGNLSRFMRHINGIYTQLFNSNNKCEGQLFKGRFKSILVDGDSYLLQLFRYIHRNPVRAKMVRHMDDFEWSSHRGYVSKSKEWDWLHKDFMLSLFLETKKRQLVVYRKFMNQEDQNDVIKILDGEKWPAFWGSDSFIQSMKEKYFKKKKDKEVPESRYLSPDIDYIKEVVCKFYSIPMDELSCFKRRPQNEPRDVAIYLARSLRNDTLDQMCGDFFLNAHSSVSTVLRKVKARKKKDSVFEKKIKEIEGLCLKSQTQI